MFPGPLGQSLAGKALTDGVWSLTPVDIRSFAKDRHRTVDDSPFGGGAGMVMRPDVLDDAIGASYPGAGPLIYFTPRGRTLTQKRVRTLAAESVVTLVCGRFEGVDQRVLEHRKVEEISLGDFVLSGGEVAAMALLDAVVRLLPGVIGRTESLEDESFETGLLEYPHYTRPDPWQGVGVPDVLKSGHHAKVASWRREQAEMVTKERRPDLWAKYQAQSGAKTPALKT
ncbi:MAG: tRNA (guanosine(37)-N1)-methyltransferase TrmD [Rhodospirillaceae bacterium]|nr:tRNA (guanosine(37)-N1)-methyltransferase TrmD [Rhodospirillaceae bacterium]